MKHKFLRAAYPILTSLLLLSAVTAERASVSTSPNLAGPSAAVIQQQPAIDAYREFQSSLASDAAGGYRYPDTYGGAYLDPETGRLCILLTDCSAETAAAYDQLFSGPSVVAYQEVEYAYNALSSMQKEIADRWDGFTTIAIDQKANRIRVGVGDMDLAEAERRIQALFAEPIPLTVTNESGTVLHASEPDGALGLEAAPDVLTPDDPSADSLAADGLIDEPHVYAVRPGMDEWAEYGSLTQMAEACDVPVEELQQMTTRALYQTVLDYPLLINICAFNDLQTGIASVSQYFGGLPELFSRPDALEVMRGYQIAEDDEDADIKAILAGYLQNYYDVMNLSQMSKGE